MLQRRGFVFASVMASKRVQIFARDTAGYIASLILCMRVRVYACFFYLMLHNAWIASIVLMI